VHIIDVPAIPFEKAAPLLCAGITTYSPLRRRSAGPGTKVAIGGPKRLIGNCSECVRTKRAADGGHPTDDGLRCRARDFLRNDRV
jgi:hypothetical protein